jgi:hypothetical protein
MAKHDDADRTIARKWIRFATRRYNETGNPVFAWEAIGDCISNGLPLPAWTRNYLRTVAVEIAHLSRGSIPPKNAIDRAIAKAVRLKGKGRFNPFRELGRPGHEIFIALSVYEYQGMHRHYSWEAIFTDVAALHRSVCTDCTRPISSATVKRYWHKHALTVIPPHLVARATSQKLDDILR